MSDLGLRVDEMLMKQKHLEDEIDLMMKQLKRANDLYAQGREDERTEIVKWLRSMDAVANHQGIHAHWFADDIESGNHLRGDDEN